MFESVQYTFSDMPSITLYLWMTYVTARTALRSDLNLLCLATRRLTLLPKCAAPRLIVYVLRPPAEGDETEKTRRRTGLP